MRRVSLLASVLAMLAAACSSPTPLAAADYFPAVEGELARLDLATKDLTDRFAVELEAELEVLVGSPDLSVPGEADRVLEQITGVTRDKMKSIVESHREQVEVFAERVAALVPPSSLASAHDELVTAFAGWADSAVETLDMLQSAAGLDGLGEVLNASPYADAQLRVDQACRVMADRAVAESVELTCPGTRLEVLRGAP